MKEYMRSLVLEALKDEPWNNQLTELHKAVKTLAQKREIAFDGQEIELETNQVVWGLLTDKVLSPTWDGKHLDFQTLQITEYGRQCIADGAYQPSDDPGKYIERLSEQIGRPLDEMIRSYTREALLTFLTGNFFPSMVMLGIASDRCIELLIKAYVTGPDGKLRKPTFAGRIKKASPASRERVELLRSDLVKASLPSEMGESLELQLSGLFTLIRYSRDAQGEAISRTVDRDTAHASLLLFPQYCKWAYDLIGRLEKAEM